MNESQQLEIVAHHESAHAIVHLAYGHKLKEIAIRGDGVGRCTLGEWCEDIGIADVERLVANEFRRRHLISHCAGKAAEDRLHGSKDQNWCARRSSGDREKAFACALKLSDNDEQAAELLVKWAERMSDVIVENHWPKIQKLAAAITEKQKFTGNGVFSHAEIKQVLGRNGSV